MTALGIIATCLTVWAFYLFILRFRISSLSKPEKLLFSIIGAVGLQSFLFFLSLIVLEGLSKTWFVYEIVFFSIVCLTSCLFPAPPITCSAKDSKKNWLSILLTTCFTASLLQLTIHLLKVVEGAPHGRWDAWVIWNMRARMLFRVGEDWKNAFDPVYHWSHTDYPLLLSGTVARIWGTIGFETQWVPALLGIGFMVATILLLFFGIWSITSLGQGALMGAACMMFTGAMLHSGSQYADTPLALYFLATMILFVHYDREKEKNPGLVFMAGIFAGFAAWTKNEGMLFIVVLLGVRTLLAIKNRQLKQGACEVVFFILGIFPFLTAHIYQGMLAPANDLMAQQPGEIIEKLSEWSRYQIIFNKFVSEYSSVGHNLLPSLSALFLLFPVSRIWWKNESLVPLCTFGGMLCGYFTLYLITPHELQWHLDHSADRLIYQLWPLLIFSFALIIKPPEKIFADPLRESSLHRLKKAVIK